MAGYTSPAWTDGSAPAIDATNLLALSQAVELGEHPYGVCSTAAATATKVVTIDFSSTLSLFAGLTIRVKFSNSNTAANPKLNVNSTGAKSIMSYGTTPATTWIAGQTLEFTYDGTNWLVTGIDGWTKAETLSAATAASVNTLTGTTPSTPDAALALITAQITGAAHIEVGSYTGTGLVSQSDPTSVTFGITPILVIVLSPRANAGLSARGGANGQWLESFLWVTGQLDAFSFVASPPDYANYYTRNRFSQSGKTLSWYLIGTDMYPALQFNQSGAVYNYICIGTKTP